MAEIDPWPSSLFPPACIKSQHPNNRPILKDAVSAATSSPDYSQQSATNNRIASRSSGGHGRLRCLAARGSHGQHTPRTAGLTTGTESHKGTVGSVYGVTLRRPPSLSGPGKKEMTLRCRSLWPGTANPRLRRVDLTTQNDTRWLL